MPDAMRDPSGRVHENSPRVPTGARTPAERSILVRQPGVDAQGVGDLRMDDLAALVQRTELFSEAVYRLTGCKCERAHPLRRPPRAADDGKPGEAAKMFVGGRNQHRLVLIQEAESQRLR